MSTPTASFRGDLMLPVLDANEAARWDANTIGAGVPSRALMESAGRGAAHVMGALYGERLGDGVLIACGHGNNGGDGWVIARALHSVGVDVAVVDLERERSPDCEASRVLALAHGVPRMSPDDTWPRCGIVVDAMLGTGASGPPRDALGAMAARLATHAPTVVGVDGPTGVDLTTGKADGPVMADLTITFGGLRRGHLIAREWCGRIIVLDIGFVAPDPAWPQFTTDAWACSVLPGLGTSAHKGDRGKVALVGGSSGMAGALYFSAKAALGGGAGLVRVVTSPDTSRVMQRRLPDVTTVTTTFEHVSADVRSVVEWADAVVIGPGLGRDDGRPRFVRELLGMIAKPIVLDADALHVGLDVLSSGTAPRILTPHLGEFRAAFPGPAEHMERDRFASARGAAALLQPTGRSEEKRAVLLKGVPTIVADGQGGVTVSGTGNPGLATGGSGDVLAGLIGAFLARDLGPRVAGSLGAHVLGRAAECGAEYHTARALRPHDVLEALPEVWERLAEPEFGIPPVLLDLKAPAVI